MATVSVRHIENPSGNPIELFEPTLPEAALPGGGRST
jgi:hypothetical protein